VVEDGARNECVLNKWYDIDRVTSTKPLRVAIRNRSDLCRDYVRLNRRAPKSTSSFEVSELLHRRCLVEVRTVTHEADGSPLILQYSKVHRLQDYVSKGPDVPF
jgi:hypothetical protein